jgi:hypothetical protein
MKGMKKILMVLMVLSMVVVFAAPASATWWDVNVVQTTTNDAGIVTARVERVTDGKKQNFDFPTGEEDRFLAMILTVQASTILDLQIEAASWSAGVLISMRVITPAP